MKATIKLYTNDGITKLGYPVKLIVTHRKKIKRRVISYSFFGDWNERQQVPSESHLDFTKLYSKIINIRSRAFSIEFREYSDIDLAINFLLKINLKVRIDFYKYAESRIEFMKLQNRYGNAEAYKCAIVALKKYKPTLYFDEITNVFLENFKIAKLSERNVLKNGTLKIISNSTVRTYLYEIRAIYNSLVRSNQVVDSRPFAGLFLDLPVKKRRVKNIYILSDGFKKLKDAKIKNIATQRTVDLTVLQFYLGGLDLVDVYYLKKSQLINGRVILYRKKLGSKAYDFDLKVFGVAQKIIDKYSSNTGDYVFPWRKDRVGYATFRSTHNKSLKNIIKKLNVTVLPISAPFTSKSVRHSFATIAKFKHIDVDIIRELMGHERSDIDTLYKDAYPEKVRDEAHFDIISTN